MPMSANATLMMYRPQWESNCGKNDRPLQKLEVREVFENKISI